jgi:predicted ATPase with chaperone activity
MLARRLTAILPAMTLAEAIETTHIHSVAGRTIATKPPGHMWLASSINGSVRICSSMCRAAQSLAQLERHAIIVWNR